MSPQIRLLHLVGVCFIHLPKANLSRHVGGGSSFDSSVYRYFCFRNVKLMMNLPPAVYVLFPCPMAVFNPAVFYCSALLLLIGPCDALQRMNAELDSVIENARGEWLC